MDKLKKSQKDEYATAFALLALYDGGAEMTADQINKLLEATGNTEVEAFYPIIFSNYLSSPEKLKAIIAVPAAGGGGGGGGGSGPASGEEEKEEEEEEKEEEEEAPDMGGGGMFGDDGGGDY